MKLGSCIGGEEVALVLESAWKTMPKIDVLQFCQLHFTMDVV